MSDAIEAALLPCPFCGGAAELVGPDVRTHIFVRCKSCAAKGGAIAWKNIHNGAIRQVDPLDSENYIALAPIGRSALTSPASGDKHTPAPDTLDKAVIRLYNYVCVTFRAHVPDPKPWAEQSYEQQLKWRDAVRIVLDNAPSVSTSPASGERDAPAGYVLVPLEPTAEIVEAMHEVWRQRERERIAIAGPSGQVGRQGWAEEYWRAALAAALRMEGE